MEFINSPVEGISYKKRVGAYGLLLDDNDRIAVVKTKTGYFLPGGGCEESETLEECLIREFREETALQIKIDTKFSAISYYFYADTLGYYMENEGHFYVCTTEKILDEKTEIDHELLWLEFEVAAESLYLENQRRAVKRFINLK